jgi:hypothetical protein
VDSSGSLRPIDKASLDVPARLAFCLGRSLVVQLLGPRHADIDLRLTPPNGHPQGDEGHPFGLDLAPQVHDLSSMNKKLSRSRGIMVRIGTVGIRSDVRSNQPQLAIVDARIRFGKRDLPRPNRLDFAPRQRDACLHTVENLIVVKGATIRRDHALVGIFGCLRFLRHRFDSTIRFRDITQHW